MRRGLRGRPVLVGGVVVVLVAVLAWAGVTWLRGSDGTGFERAVAMVPAATKRVSFTDWAQVRARLGVRGTDSTPAQLSRWLDRAYGRDYSATSSMSDNAVAIARAFGFSPANASWEAYAQSDAGSAMVLRMDDGVSFSQLSADLTSAGFTRPKSATGVWTGGPDLLATIDPEITPELQYVVLLPDQHAVVTSDTAGYAAAAAKVARGDARSLADADANSSTMAGQSAEPIAAVMWTRDYACSDLAMSQASAGAQQQAQQLIAAAGKTSALSGLTMAMAPDRSLRVIEAFDSGSQANQNLKARATLAVGPAVGRGSDTFATDFKLTSARTRGASVVLTLVPRDPSQFVISALYDGPVIFATC